MDKVKGFIFTESAFCTNLKSFSDKRTWIRRNDELIVLSNFYSITDNLDESFSIRLSYEYFNNNFDEHYFRINAGRLIVLFDNSIFGEKRFGKAYGHLIKSFNVIYLDINDNELTFENIESKCIHVDLRIKLFYDHPYWYEKSIEWNVDDINIVNTDIYIINQTDNCCIFKVVAECSGEELLISGLAKNDFKFLGKYKKLNIIENDDCTYTLKYKVAPDGFTLKCPNENQFDIKTNTIIDI